MVQAGLQHLPVRDGALLQGVHDPPCAYCRPAAAAVLAVRLRRVVIAHHSL